MIGICLPKFLYQRISGALDEMTKTNRIVQQHERRTRYVFFRDGMFYPIEMKDDADACANAECNPGTTRVEDANGRVVWRPQLTLPLRSRPGLGL